jgi:hypothetical protein
LIDALVWIAPGNAAAAEPCLTGSVTAAGPGDDFPVTLPDSPSGLPTASTTSSA